MATEKMNIDERYKYLRMVQERYRQADRQAKGRMLDEACFITAEHRKYVITCLNKPDLRRHRRNRERSRVYGADVEHVVGLVADALDWIGADRLQPGLVATAQHLARFGHLSLSDELLSKLQNISISSVRRILQRIGRPVGTPPQVRRGRRPDSVVQALVPIGFDPQRRVRRSGRAGTRAL